MMTLLNHPPRISLASSLSMLSLSALLCSAQTLVAEAWTVSGQEAWDANKAKGKHIEVSDGFLQPMGGEVAYFESKAKQFPDKRHLRTLTVKQSDLWQNWNPRPNIGPLNLGDSPVFVSVGPQDYWLLGRYHLRSRDLLPGTVELEGYDEPLRPTKQANLFIAPSGLQRLGGGYQAWHSRDMETWVFYGAVTEDFSAWVTNAEYADGKFYIYYDFPNDQDPHVYVDSDLRDGKPGANMGMALNDPSHGSDSAVIRDKEGNFHIIFEDWSPIHPNSRSFDSPLAGHAVSPDGLSDFQFLAPAVDERTTPTGIIKTFKHPHWVKENPERFQSDIGEYEVHKPEQFAYGDWSAICVGDQYYLFGDMDPPGKHAKKPGVKSAHMSVGWFTSDSLYKQFTFCDEIGEGHPDPDICFAEGQFYLATQQKTDYTSPGPWVESVDARVGVDTDNDGKSDVWSDWQAVKEQYDHTPGFAKQVQRTPAQLDLKELPAGYAFEFQLRLTDTTENKSKPMIEAVTLDFQ